MILIVLDPVERPYAKAAILCAQQISRAPGFIGAWAFSHTGYPEIGWYEDVEFLKRPAASRARGSRPVSES
jgi:hypothetical protein